LQPGRYNLRAELLDPAGQAVAGVFNRVERSFQVRRPIRAEPALPPPAAIP
jgi:hypothetical protein